ncbi:hypothetical protein BDY19DRAFT_991440 [Irpex rosettiformis]|uniref:Uncharacterized protein n=1 Tax=Irpex rosettiformis TaxID=378272 RepID=A0ACB8UBJ2_9APHY|nr:hypothetical protein BDY19DRAFT_991440 [Irpex rosettiformis]
MATSTGATSATQAKDRNYLQLSNSLARLSRVVGQTADLCDLLKVDLNAMKMLAASHAAQFMTVAAELNPEQEATDQDDEDQSR